MTAEIEPDSLTTEEIFGLERPDPGLLTYYVLASLMAGPFFPFVLLPLYFRYHTMRYRFSDEGVSMRWGILFRKEINLTFARIQDIHLTSNFVERWLGLARIQIQTASGSAKAEITIEGIRQYRSLRNFLYARMRGAKGMGAAVAAAVEAPQAAAASSTGPPHEIATVLREVAFELRSIRRALESLWTPGAEGDQIHD